MNDFCVRILVAMGLAFVAGCEDKVGARDSDVEVLIAAHATDSSAHHPKTVDAGELTAGTLDAARLPAFIATDLATHTADIADQGQRLTTSEASIAAQATTLSSHGNSLASHTTDITALNTAVGARVSKAGDTMTGALTVPDVVWTNPKTKIVSVQAFAFTPESSATTWDGVLPSHGFRTMTGAPLRMAAPIHFPDGVTLTALSARVYDSTNPGFVRVTLRKFDGNTASFQIGAVQTTDAETDFFTTRTAAISHAVTNGGTGSYYLFWEQNIPGNTSNGPGLFSVTVAYTYTSP